MHIVFAASECVPFSKTGGLADVVGALPRALVAAGHQVSVYLPRYRETLLQDPKAVVKSITIPFDDLLIGACALERGYAVATRNQRHFHKIPGLKLISV